VESSRNSKLTSEVWTSVDGEQKRRISRLSSVGRRGGDEEDPAEMVRPLRVREKEESRGEEATEEEEMGRRWEGREERASISMATDEMRVLVRLWDGKGCDEGTEEVEGVTTRTALLEEDGGREEKDTTSSIFDILLCSFAAAPPSKVEFAVI